MSRLAKQALWRKRVSAFERSGLTRRAWCAQAGVALATLDYWRARLRRLTDIEPTLVPIMVSDRVPAKVDEIGAGRVEIALGAGLFLRADAQVNTQWLAALLRGLR